MESMTTKQVCELTGTTEAQLRHYGKIGLLCPERTGEGVANNRRLYTSDDLERLKKVLVLQKYGLELKLIQQVIDADDDELLVVLGEQLIELRREQTRLKNLIVFAHFARIVSDDMFEALANGAYEIDDFAELMMGTPEFEAGCEASNAMDEATQDELLNELIGTMLGFVIPDHEQTFSDWEAFVDRLQAWWGRDCPPMDHCGLLGNWVMFTCNDELAYIAERIGGEETPGFMQAAIFLVWAKRTLISFEKAEKKLKVAEGKGAEAVSKARVQILRSFCQMTGADKVCKVLEPESCAEFAIDLCEGLFGYLDGLLSSPTLREFVDPKGKVKLSHEGLSQVEEAIKDAARKRWGAAMIRTR